MDTSDSALRARITKLYTQPRLSDITLTTTTPSGQTSLPCHRAILLTVTPFFETALSPESGFTESSSKTVALDEHTPSALKAFLEFCYTGKYTFSSEPIVSPALDFEVYQLADYLLAIEVKEYAGKMLKERLDSLPEMEIGDKKADFLPGLLRVVYEAGADEVKEFLITVVVQCLEKRGHGFMVPLLEVMMDYGEFSTAIAEGLVKGGIGRTVIISGKCAGCGNWL